MRKRILLTILAVLVFKTVFVIVLIILIPEKIIAPWPSLSPDFEIKQLNASCLVFSPNGKHIAIANMDGWDVVDFQTREIVATYRGKKDYVSQICFSPDGKKLLTTNEYNNIILWDIESKQVLFRLDDIDFCRSSGFSSDGTKIIAAIGGVFSKTGYAGIWNIETGKPEIIFPTGCSQVDYAPDEKSVILAHYNQIERWDVETGKKINNITVLEGRLDDYHFLSDGKQIMVAFPMLGNAILIDIESERILNEF